MAQAPAAIAFDAVSKRYGDARASALDRVSLDVAGREFLAVVGPSGSGKTTLLRLVNRLADPSEGTVRFEGRGRARARRRSSCGAASATCFRASACFRI